MSIDDSHSTEKTNESVSTRYVGLLGHVGSVLLDVVSCKMKGIQAQHKSPPSVLIF